MPRLPISACLPFRRRPTPGHLLASALLHRRNGRRPRGASCTRVNIRQSATRSKPVGGAFEPAERSSACSMDAECIQKQGTATPGDRNVAIDCKGKTCTCTQEQLMPRMPRRKFRFAVDAPCASMERVQSLLLDHCVQARADSVVLLHNRAWLTPPHRHSTW